MLCFYLYTSFNRCTGVECNNLKPLDGGSHNVNVCVFHKLYEFSNPHTFWNKCER